MMNNFFKNIVTNPNIDELKNDLKKKENLIEKLREKLKKVLEEKEFVTKSYEQLEKKSATLEKKKGNEGNQFKQNMQYYLNALQKVPDEIMQTMIEILLSKFEEHIGEKIDSSTSQSFLDIDFNYKNIFAEHAAKIFQATRERILFDEKKSEMVNIYEDKLASKDKQIEQLIDRYENQQKNMEKQFESKVQGKIKELNMLKEQKTVMFAQNNENLNRMIVQIEDLKKEVNKLKSSQNQLKVQKDKIENKYSEVLQMNKHLLNKNTELEMDLKTANAEKQIMVQQAIKQNTELKESLKKQIAELQQLKKQRAASDHDIQRMLDQLKLCQQENDQIKLEYKSLSISNEENKDYRGRLEKKIQNVREKISLISNLKQVVDEKSSIEASILQFNEFFNSLSTQFSKKYEELQKSGQNQEEIPKVQQHTAVDFQPKESNFTSLVIQPMQTQDVLEQKTTTDVVPQKSSQQLESLRIKIQTSEQQLQQSRKSLLKLQNNITNLREKLQNSEKNLDISKQANIKLQEELNLLKQNISAIQSEKMFMIHQYEKKHLTLSQQIETKQQELLKLNEQNASRIQEIMQKIASFETSNNTLLVQKASLQNNLDISRVKISQFQQKIDEKICQSNIKEERIKQLQKQIIPLQQSFEALRKQFEISKIQLQNSNKQLQNRQELLKNAGSSQYQLQQQMSKVKELLLSMEQKQRALEQQLKDKQLEHEKIIIRLTDETNIRKQLCEKISHLQGINNDLEMNITNLNHTLSEKDSQSQKYSQEILRINEQIAQKDTSLKQFEGQVSNLTIILEQTKKKCEQLQKSIKNIEQNSQRQKQQLIKQAKNRQKQLQRDLQEKQREKGELNYQLQRSQQRQKIISEEMNSKQGNQNDSLHLIKELQHKYQSQIDAKHHQITLLEQRITQYQAKIQQTESKLQNSDRQILKIRNEVQISRNYSTSLQIQFKETLRNAEEKFKQDLIKKTDEANHNDNIIKDSLAKMLVKRQQTEKQLNQLKTQKLQLIQTAQKQKKILLDSIENVKSDILQKDDELVILRQQMQSQKEQKTRKQQQIKLNLDQIRNLRQQIEIKKELISGLRLQQSQLQNLNAVIQLEQTQTVNECNVIRSQLSQAIKAYKILQQNNSQLTIKNQQLEENIPILNAQIERYQEKQQKVKGQIDSLRIKYNQQHSQLQKLKQTIESITAENVSRNEQLKAINQKYEGALLHVNLLEKSKIDIQEQHRIKLEEIQQQLEASKAEANHLRQQILSSNKALKDKQQEYTTFISSINEQHSSLQKSYEQLKALSTNGNKQNIQRINLLLAQKQQALNSLNILENNIQVLSTKIQQHQKENTEQQAQINEKSQALQKILNHNSHLLEKIQEQQRQIEENRKQIELSQLTNTEILSTIATLRSQLQQKVAQYQQSTQVIQLNNKKINQQMQKTIYTMTKQLQQSEQAADKKAIALNQQISQLSQTIKNKEQSIMSLQCQIQSKTQQIKQLLISLSDLQKKLAHQIQQKAQALEDKQFMSQLYKDFEARQTQIGVQQKKLKQFQQDALYFFNILHKQFTKQSINSIKNINDLMKIEIKQQKDESKMIEDRLNEDMLKINQELIEQTNMATHFESKFNELNAVKQNLGRDLQEKQKQILKLRKQFKDKELQILNEKNKLEQVNQKLKIQVQQFKAKITKKESEVSKFSDNIIEIQQKFNNTKRMLDDKEREVILKDNQLIQLKKQVQIFKNKMLEQNKQKVEEKDYYEKQLHKLRTQIERMIVQSAQNAKKQQAAREDVVKNEKIALDKMHKEEIRKIKESIESYKKQKEDSQKELSSTKNQLLQQRKISAKITAKLNEVTAQLAKLENLQLSSQEIQQKMLLKDEEIKKCFANIQSLKSTIMDLQQGIQTYQSMAEQKDREVQQQRQKCVSLQREMQRMKNDLQRNERKLKDVRMQKKVQQVINDKKDIVDKKQSSILPLKLLFLKYFQIGANYEAKLRAFNTLCEALSLNSKELQQMNQYKKTKLILQVPNSEKQKNQSLQNKFFNFLNSD